jgi:phytoene dehydrogenase-like protein
MNIHEYCSADVHDTFGVGFHQCSHKAVTVEDGKPVCGTHTKAAEERRSQRSDAAYGIHKARWASQAETERRAACYPKLLAALEALVSVLDRGLQEAEENIVLSADYFAALEAAHEQAREAIAEATS